MKGEICLKKGTVMCLVFKARSATKDVDAIFEPCVSIIYNVRISEAHNYDLIGEIV